MSPSRSTAEGKGPSADLHAAARLRERRGARRRHGGRDVCAEARARRAAFRRGPADLLARPITRRAPFDEIDARDPARLGALQGRQVRGRALSSNTSASRTGGAPSCRSAAAATISNACATSSIAIATSPSRASPARTISSARSSPRASGRRATISRRSRTAASSTNPAG